MTHTGGLNSHDKRRRRSTDTRGTNRHYIKRKSSMKIRDRSNQSGVIDLIHSPCRENLMKVGVQSLCSICALDLRIFTHDSAVKSTLFLSNEGDVVFIKDNMHSFMSQQSSTCETSSGKTSSYKLEDLNPICTIGTGTFGKVKLVQHTPSGKVFALKVMRKDDIVAFRQHKNVMSEKNLLLACAACPFTIDLVATHNRPNLLYMVMEYVPGGELLTHMYDRDDTVPRSALGGFHLDVVRFYGATLVAVFEFFLTQGIVYRDVKPENLLIDSQGYMKVADFGFAKVLPYVEGGCVVDKTYTLCGTPDYLAPGDDIERRGFMHACKDI